MNNERHHLKEENELLRTNLRAKEDQTRELRSRVVQLESAQTLEFPVMVNNNSYGAMVRNDGFIFDRETPRHVEMVP